MRVIGIDPEAGFSGGETQVLGLTLELLSLGHQAELLCDPAGALWQRASATGVVCHPLRIRNSVDVGAGFALRRFLLRNAFDVVHFHTARAHALAPFAGRCARALVVTRRMDYRPNRLFAPYLYNRAVDAVAAISERVAQAMAEAGVRWERIAVIPSGVDCRWFRPPNPEERAKARAALGLCEGEVAIGTLGALEPRKGHRYLLEGLAALGTERKGLRCLVGGEGSLGEALHDHAARLGLGDSVRFLGRVEDRRAFFWALDIFALPSIREGLGVALLEAMAGGLPAIATGSSGSAEVVAQERTGLLVEPTDRAALGRAVGRLAAERDLRQRMGAAGRARAVEHFDLRVMASRTLELYRSCLDERARACGEGRSRECGA